MTRREFYARMLAGALLGAPLLYGLIWLLSIAGAAMGARL